QVATQDIDLTLAQAYLEQLVHLEVRSGQLSSTLHVQLQELKPLQLEITGQAGVQQLHIVDGPARRDLLMWQSPPRDDIRDQGSGLLIYQLHLYQRCVRYIINRDVSSNSSVLVRALPEREASSAEGEPSAIRICVISITDGSSNFADLILTPNFAT